MEQFPSDNELFNLKVFPYPEGQVLEFKETSTVSFKDKILVTLCAFLNSGGGHLVIGIKDNLEIAGVNVPPKLLDSFILKLDSIHHHSIIVTCDNEKIPHETIITRTVTLSENRLIIVIKAIPMLFRTYKLNDGSLWYRLTCSNYKISSIKVYNQSQVMSLIEKERREVQSQYIEFLNALKEDRQKEYERTLQLQKEKENLEKENKVLREIVYSRILLQKREAEDKMKIESSVVKYLLNKII